MSILILSLKIFHFHAFLTKIENIIIVGTILNVSEFHLLSSTRNFFHHTTSVNRLKYCKALFCLCQKPTSCLLCNLFIICKKLLHRITTQIIVHNAGSKNKFLEAGTPCLITEEQRHRCKTALLLLRRNGFGK